MRRVALVGVLGSGKTTLGRRLAESLDVAFVELDSIFHQPDWTDLPRDEFRERVGEALTADGWVVDGNYGAVRDLVWQRADCTTRPSPTSASSGCVPRRRSTRSSRDRRSRGAGRSEMRR